MVKLPFWKRHRTRIETTRPFQYQMEMKTDSLNELATAPLPRIHQTLDDLADSAVLLRGLKARGLDRVFLEMAGTLAERKGCAIADLKLIDIIEEARWAVKRIQKRRARRSR